MARVAALLATGLILTACSSGPSGEKREYAIPSSLCGAAISPSALELLLPAGKKTSTVKSGPSGFTRCRLVVDGRVAVSSVIEQWESGTTLRNVAYGTYGLSSASVKKEESGYIISQSTAVGHASCSKLQKEGHEVFTMIRKENGAVDTAAMEKAITEFTDAVSTSKQCTESDG
ncbi:hypothetical protein [Streptomyces chiangmaiensis]|uniref:DUF3558 domain-containing protein n=1 Tax=Streptomyces chiangmaiensis TaxID=766497 RepID=A0ABU7FVQ9_9ACTN|nr:hypothetical protein [Streptomyces chiangmaiensis]MED7828201.1 hypothetical protein [Streptomyces chiangmaiensis]